MKRFWQKAVALCLCIAVSVSAMVAPASAVAIGTIVAGLELVTAAAGAVKALAECTSSVTEMVSDLKGFLKPSTPSDASMWIASSYWAAPDGHRCELASVSTLEYISQDWNANYASEVGFSTTVAKRELYDGRTFYVIRCLEVGGRRGEQNMEYYLCDGNARVLCVDTTVTPTIYDGTWKSIRTLRSPYSLVSYAELYNLANAAGGKVQKSGNLYLILNSAGTQYYATPSGLAYAYMPTDESASGSDRPTDSVIEVGGDGSQNTVSVDGDNTKIDIANGVLTGLDGTLQIIDGVIYDESTKTYYIDSHDSYTTNIYNYYTYQYYINYTSITYIGYTEQYDKHYEVYYKLPDGRSSADLTAEELEQLNLSVDVINYGRSADDVSLRSLYHFDGDTDDSSYWNYCTSFEWNKGASLTYMDEGTFEGSLYLDETEHDFTITLPSGLGGADFTLQWRMYQSHTEAPETDSYVKLGGSEVLYFDGQNIKSSTSTALASMPIGTWNELALIRDSGTLYYYLNGVKIGNVVSATVFDKITFHFGSGQQTFKKLDELRVLNYAFQKGGASYTPTSVPHDTNLTLVLPDSTLPVADEYWDIKQDITPVVSYDFSKGAFSNISGSFAVDNAHIVAESSSYSVGTDRLTLAVPQTGSVVAGSTGNNYWKDSSTQLDGVLNYCMFVPFVKYDREQTGNYSYASNQFTSAFPSVSAQYDATFSILYADGTQDSFSFAFEAQKAKTARGISANYFYIQDSFEFSWGTAYVIYYCLYQSYRGIYGVLIAPNSTAPLDIVYMELVAGDTPNTGHEHVTSITPMSPDDLATPTLAVRSDIPISSWQIGGVRPSVPTKGQVWALVERQYITSLQIYNGRAWEACDGRIWTGARWVPYSSYNVITLKDMSDIVDSSSSDHEYIYTESGFWDWLQRWLTQFKTDLFARLDKLKGSGTDSSASSSALPDIPAGSGDYDFSDSSEDVTLPDAAKDSAGGLWAFIKGVWKLVGGAFQNAGKAVSDLTDAADTTNPDGAFGFFLIPLEEEGG